MLLIYNVKITKCSALQIGGEEMWEGGLNILPFLIRWKTYLLVAKLKIKQLKYCTNECS